MVLFFDFLIWWYTKGLVKTTQFLGGVFTSIVNFFSVEVIVKTFFTPWKRLVFARRPGLDGLWDFLLDNLVSRFVGVVMRTFLLLTFLLTFVVFLIFAAAIYLFWIFNVAFIAVVIWGLSRGSL